MDCSPRKKMAMGGEVKASKCATKYRYGGEVKKMSSGGEAKKGLYANIHAKRKRIAEGSGEKMRKKGAKGAPTEAQFAAAAKTAKKRNA